MSEDKKLVYSGKIISLETATVDLPNGQRMDLEIVRHPGGAAVVAINDKDQVCLLRQYRPALGAWLWELPAGKIDHGEPPLETAHRELAEEAGVQASEWHDLGSVISSPGVFTEEVFLYLAKDLRHVGEDKEDHEVFETHWINFDDAVQKALSGEITDGKTVAALLRASNSGH
jgi:ADP-ribose pyrophosphatase